MRIPAQIQRRSASFNLTPMIDMVFLLIVFFLLSSHFSRQDVYSAIALPIASADVVPARANPTRFVIEIDSSGAMLVDGAQLRLEELRRRLTAEFSNHTDAMEVNLRSARDAKYAVMEPILLACAELGIWKISLSVQRPAGQR